MIQRVLDETADKQSGFERAQPAVLFELIHIPKRAPELDIAVRRSQLREKRIRSEEVQLEKKT